MTIVYTQLGKNFFLLNDCMLCQLERGVRGAGWLSQYSSREKMVLVLPSDDVQ